MEKERGIKITKAYDEEKSDGIISNIKICCPNCESENISDHSIREKRTRPIRMGGRPLPPMPKILDIRGCDHCGTMFKPTKGNGL